MTLAPWILCVACLAPPKTHAPTPQRGTGLLAAGGTLMALGLGGRVALDVFWGRVAGLRAQDPYGTWSNRLVLTTTNMANVLVVPGLAMALAGSYRRGKAQARQRGAAGSAADWSRWSRRRTFAAILTGSGAALWVLGRALWPAAVHRCGTNACVYGTLEGTYWGAVALAVPGSLWLAHGEGQRAGRARFASGRWQLGPWTSANGHRGVQWTVQW